MMSILLPLALLAAAAPQDKLPPANPLPPPGTDEGQVVAPIKTLFDGLTKRDPALILAAMRPDASAIAVIEKADGGRTIRRLSAADFAAGIKPGPERLEERLTGPAIDIDGDIAMVWSPYVFMVDGKVVHCGVDHFDMVRENGSWKIANITWTQRTTGCPVA